MILQLIATLAVAHVCGVERLPVKTASDVLAKSIPVRAEQTTVEQLVSLSAPTWHVAMPRLPAEAFLYELKVRLVKYKLESDRDYHLVVAGKSGAIMAAESLNPKCATRSWFKTQIAQTRGRLDVLLPYKAQHTFRVPRKAICLRMVGAFFFDRIHGEGAKNGAELHPLTEVEAISCNQLQETP